MKNPANNIQAEGEKPANRNSSAVFCGSCVPAPPDKKISGVETLCRDFHFFFYSAFPLAVFPVPDCFPTLAVPPHCCCAWPIPFHSILVTHITIHYWLLLKNGAIRVSTNSIQPNPAQPTRRSLCCLVSLASG